MKEKGKPVLQFIFVMGVILSSIMLLYLMNLWLM